MIKIADAKQRNSTITLHLPLVCPSFRLLVLVDLQILVLLHEAPVYQLVDILVNLRLFQVNLQRIGRIRVGGARLHAELIERLAVQQVYRSGAT